MGDSLQSLFTQVGALPTVPKVVQQLIDSFQREDISVDAVAAQLASDPVLSAKTLRLANSAYFHVSRQISTVDEALQVLGFVMVRNLVLGAGLAQSFKHLKGMDLPQFWHHSLHTACGARWLAGISGHNADLAFMVGLLQGLGHLVLRSVTPKAALALDAQAHPLAAERAEVERAALGYHHGAVSAEMARLWRFPADITQALAAVPDAAACTAAGGTAALVHVAAWRARIEALGLTDEAAQAAAPAEVARTLNLKLTWGGEPPTAQLRSDGQAHAMPALADLTQGLEPLFD